LSIALIARHRGGVDFVGGEREGRRDHRDVAQRQGFERRDVDGAAAHLRGVLRRADHGGANAFVGALELRSPAFGAGADFLRQQGAEIAAAMRLARVDIFGDAAGERHLVDDGARRQRVEAQQS
jgi:hypothetical protein